ncbi:metalloregulator ArsR/SmtB family transcription factor [Pantoea agglomerans]|uniref:ArsR/SmtB family transcription factor n=1 Tax=Enterobacter agglomerans TaxID=549 RepID=UPI0032096270
MSIRNDDATRQLYTHWADVARTLGNSHRVMLLQHITQAEYPVERLAELANLSVANASQHLQHLKRAGFVQARREGKHVYYGLSTGPVTDLLNAIRRYVDHQHQEIHTLVADRVNQTESLESISREELLERLKAGDVTLLDVRPQEEYQAGHLPGAINIPVEELNDRLSELKQEQTVVAYCRGPYCVLSSNAVKALQKKGFDARQLNEGFPEWQAAGLNVDR